MTRQCVCGTCATNATPRPSRRISTLSLQSTSIPRYPSLSLAAWTSQFGFGSVADFADLTSITVTLSTAESIWNFSTVFYADGKVGVIEVSTFSRDETRLEYRLDVTAATTTTTTTDFTGNLTLTDRNSSLRTCENSSAKLCEIWKQQEFSQRLHSAAVYYSHSEQHKSLFAASRRSLLRTQAHSLRLAR